MYGHHSIAAKKLSAMPRPGFRGGGLIRGPGTGTSDSIPAEVPAGTYILPKDTTEATGLAARALGNVPVAVSNGEYEITPKQVQAIGASVLDILRGVTHAPVEEEEDAGEEMQGYANGGQVMPGYRMDAAADPRSTVYGSSDPYAASNAARMVGLANSIGSRGVMELGRAPAPQPPTARNSFGDAAAATVDPTVTQPSQVRRAAYADGGMVNDVTRTGNSYSGGNVGGNITVNGQTPGGTFSQVSAGAAAPAPAVASPAAAAAPATAPAPAVAAATPATAAPAPAPAAPMGWAERNAQRSLEVSASSIMPSAERDAAQSKLASMSLPAPAPTPAATATVTPTPVGAAGLLGQLPQPILGAARPSLIGQRQGFANGGMVQSDEKRRALIDQIPTGGMSAPPSDGSQSNPFNSEVGRNVTNTLAALPGVSGAAPMLGQAAQALRAVPAIGVGNAALSATMGAAGAAGTVGLPAAAVSAALPSMAEDKATPANAASQAPVGGQVASAGSGAPAAAAPVSTGSPSTAQTPAVFGARAILGSVPETPGLDRPNLNVQAPMVRHSGNDWAARKQLENLQTAASSITNQPRWGGLGERSDASQAYQRALANDLSLQGAEGNMAQAAMEQRGANARAQLADVGALDRTLITERGNNARAAITAEGQTLAAAIKARQAAALEAQKANKDNVQQAKDTQDIFSIINEARPVLRGATGSALGAGLDKVAQGVGYTTDGAKATSQLQVLQGALISKMPKMSGPQSDKDVELYKQMAGQIGDPTTPRAQRMAAMDTIENLNMKYLPQAQNEAGLAQVPSGSWFRAPDGSIRRKP